MVVSEQAGIDSQCKGWHGCKLELNTAISSHLGILGCDQYTLLSLGWQGSTVSAASIQIQASVFKAVLIQQSASPPALCFDGSLKMQNVSLVLPTHTPVNIHKHKCACHAVSEATHSTLSRYFISIQREMGLPPEHLFVSSTD